MSSDFNKQFKSNESTGDYHSFLVETRNNEAVVSVASYVTEDMGLDLDENYENAQKAGLMITIITAIFTLISIVIIGIAAVNIMHTFLMVIVERRKEIGLMRALGATKANISFMILLEAMFVGLIGGSIGAVFGVGVGLRQRRHFCLRHPTLSVSNPTPCLRSNPGFLPWVVGGAILFCLIGAFLFQPSAPQTWIPPLH